MKLLSIKQCNAAISNIKMNGKALDGAIQDVGLSVIQHCAANGEVSLAIKLLNAMPRGSRRTALVAWFVEFGPIAVELDKAKAKTHPLVFNKLGALDVAGAAEKPWFECKPEKALADEFDFTSRLNALLKQAANAAEKGLTVKGSETLLAVHTLLAGGVALPDAVTTPDELEEAV